VSLALAVLATQLMARGEFTLSGVTGARDGFVMTAIVANLVVPLVAGWSLGFIARRSLLALSVAQVLLSLAGTYASLGSSGLPTGSKIIEYCLQLALIYLAARWGAAFAFAWSRTSTRPT
jgi:hypothetical protein